MAIFQTSTTGKVLDSYLSQLLVRKCRASDWRHLSLGFSKRSSCIIKCGLNDLWVVSGDLLKVSVILCSFWDSPFSMDGSFVHMMGFGVRWGAPRILPEVSVDYLLSQHFHGPLDFASLRRIQKLSCSFLFRKNDKMRQAHPARYLSLPCFDERSEKETLSTHRHLQSLLLSRICQFWR